MKTLSKIISLLVVSSLACTPVAFAKHAKHKHKRHSCGTQACAKRSHSRHMDYKFEQSYVSIVKNGFVPGFYVGANVGESRVHDKRAPGSADSVTQIGPGWNVDLGYRFVEFYKIVLAAELGFTQYYHSSETTPGVNVATTEHFTSDAALVGQYYFIPEFSVFGKLGVAYNYAKKVFTASGTSKSANAYSLYYGLGVAYNVTSQAAVNLQWARAQGNNSTGSADLISLGITYAFA